MAHKAGKSVDNENRPDDGHARPQQVATNHAGDRGEQASEMSFLGIKLGEGLLVMVTILLVLVTRDLVNGADDTAKRQLRSYVYIDGGEFDYSKTHDAFRGHIVLKNFGQTPAYGSEVYASVRIFDANAPTFDFTKSRMKRSAKTTIGPTAENNIDRNTRAAPGDLEAVIQREKRIFMWGVVTYRDAFEKDQTLEFRCVSSLLRSGDNTWVMEPYPEGESE